VSLFQGDSLSVISECMLIRLRALFFAFSIFSAKAGTQVIVPFRDEDEKRHLKVMGDLGQIVPLVRTMSNLRFLDASDRCMPTCSGSVGMGHEERTTNRRVPATLGCCV